MSRKIKFILFISAIALSLHAHGAETLPPAIKGFCDLAFAGKIASPGQQYNATDVAMQGVPQRRILDYTIGDHYAYIWYEHGGRHYHQHLVKFSKTRPYEVKASYVFDSTSHQDIHELINDRQFLTSHLSNQCGL